MAGQRMLFAKLNVRPSTKAVKMRRLLSDLDGISDL